MFCKNCGKKLSDNAKFCTGCGEKITAEDLIEKKEDVEVEDEKKVDNSEPKKKKESKKSKEKVEEPKAQKPAEPQVVYYQPAQPQREIRDARDLPPEFKPISAWGYVGYNLLFGLPIAGFIILLVFACGGHSNKNVQNYALSFFCAIILVVLIFVILALMGVGLAATLWGTIQSIG